MACRVADVARILEDWAPVSTADEGDNNGLLAGLSSWPVSSVLIALDVNEDVLRYAANAGSDMIVAHHPFLYRQIASVSDASEAGRLAVLAIGLRVAVYAAHTSLDRTAGGVVDALCDAVGLVGAAPAAENSIGRVARALPGDTLDRLALRVRSALSAPAIRLTGRHGMPVERVYVVSGAGRRDIAAAATAKADCMLTGEIGYHDGQAAAALGLGVIEAGHYHTEKPALCRIEKHLQSQFQRLQYTVRTEVYEKSTCPFRYLD